MKVYDDFAKRIFGNKDRKSLRRPYNAADLQAVYAFCPIRRRQQQRSLT